MSNDKGFRSMGALVDALRKAEEGLRGGALPLRALDQAADDARELYERLIVLRHKAREAAFGKAAPKAGPEAEPEAAKPQAPPPAPAAAASAPPAKARPEPAQGPAIRLQTHPTPARDAPAPKKAEEAPVMKTAAEFLREAQAAKSPAPAAAKAGESIAEKLERARIADLAKAISLSDKFWFTKELFGGDAKAYEVGVSLLNSAKDLGEAQRFLREELLTKLKTQPDPEALEAFNELVERRFA